MAATRCAHPEYQLEVDTLMIEYVLYKAVEAQLQLLRRLSVTQSSHANGIINSLVGCAESAACLTETYDTLILLFKRQHGDGALREGIRLDAYILQILVLFNMWLQSRTQFSYGPTLEISSGMQMRLERDRFIEQFFRQDWLKHREHGYKADVVASEQVRRRRNSELSLADHLLPHFIYLVREIRLPNTALSEKWMILASTFMIHAAIELLDAPDFLGNNIDVARLALEECFAWGHVDRPGFKRRPQVWKHVLNELIRQNPRLSQLPTDETLDHIQDTAYNEDECDEQFYDQGLSDPLTSEGGRPRSSGELSQWTRIRQEALDVVLETFATMQEEAESERHCPVDWLRNQYQLPAFLSEITEFFSIHWVKLHAAEWHGKPALISIEEGGLPGLGADEFEEFKIRARIDTKEWSVNTNL